MPDRANYSSYAIHYKMPLNRRYTIAGRPLNFPGIQYEYNVIEYREL